MKLSEISSKHPALQKATERFTKPDNVFELSPPQEEAIKAGVLDGENVLLSIPTAIGKTLVAELAALNCILGRKKKAVYVVPLRALASEKYHDWKLKYGDLARIGISTGDFDSSGASLENLDLIIVTIEKMDSIMRHTPSWINEIGLAILDEVHLIDSVNRGPTLEIVATQLKDLRIQILALSATVENSDAVAGWLKAKLVESNFRPIKLSRGIFLKGEIDFMEKSDLKIEHNSKTEPSVSI